MSTSNIIANNPLGQTFFIQTSRDGGNGENSSGVFLTKIDLFFASKHATVPVAVEIREVDPTTAYITNRVVPYSKVILQPSDVNVNAGAPTYPTPVIFTTPIYLLNDTDYAFVIIPLGDAPGYSLWKSRIGEDDLVTGNRITKQPYAGVLFASSNDRVWSPIQEEDLTFRLYVADFGINQSGTAIFKNIDREYLTLSNTDGAFSTAGETINGETTLTMSGSISANASLSLLGLTSGANGVITYNSGTTVRVKEVTLAADFVASENVQVMFANGSPTATTGTINSLTIPTGKVFFYDPITQSNTILHLSEPSGTFAANTWIRGQINGRDAKIVSVDNVKADEFYTFVGRLGLQNTSVTTTGKFATSGSALDSAFRSVVDNGKTVYSTSRYILSKSNEAAGISGSKSGELKFSMSNATNRRHSPAIDINRTALFATENIINNDSTNEDSTDGGNALARYITRTITLADGQDAEDLKVFLTAYKPSSASILVYYKILHGEDGDTMEDRSWVQMTQVTSSTVVSDGEETTDYKEYEYRIPDANLTGTLGEVQYSNSSGVTYTGFKYFKIKIVLLSTLSTRVPRVKDFRTIALQI